MRRAAAIFCAPLAALALTACATAPLIPPSDTVVVAQGETTLDLAFNVPAKVYMAHVSTMDPGLKATVKPLLLRAGAIVQASDAAEVLGNETSMGAQIADAYALIGQAKAALGVH